MIAHPLDEIGPQVLLIKFKSVLQVVHAKIKHIANLIMFALRL